MRFSWGRATFAAIVRPMEDNGPGPWNKRRRRFLHALWLGPASFLLLANLMLWTPLFRFLIETTPPVRLDYGFAYMIVPGRIVVSDYHMTVSDRVVQMQIDVEQAEVDLAFFTMFEKKIVIERIEAEGLRLRMRPVLDPESAKAPWVEYCPPIEGIPMPPLFRHPERPKKPTEQLWKVRLTNIDVGLDEVWVGPVRLRGPGRLSGGFELHPRQMIEVLPSRLTWLDDSPARLSLGENELSPATSMVLDVRIPSYHLDGGRAVLDVIEGSIQAKASFEHLETLSSLLPPDTVSIGRARGSIDINAAIQAGRLRDDSTIHLAADPAQLIVNPIEPQLILSGPLDFGVSIASSSDGQKARAELTWRDLRVDSVDHEVPAGPEVKLLSANASVSLAKRLSDSTFDGGEFRLEDARAPDLRFFNPMLQTTPARLNRGHATLSVVAKVDEDFGTDGFVELHAFDVGLTVDDLATSFAATFKAEVEQDSDSGVLGLAPVTLQVRPLTLYLEDRAIPWWFVLSTTKTKLNTKTGNKFSILALEGPSLKPFIDALIEQDLAQWAGKLVLGDGGTEAKLRLAQSLGSLRLDLLAFKSGRVAVDGVVLTQGEELKGALLLIGSVLRVGILLPPGEKRVHPTASRDWLERQLAEQGIPKIEHEHVRGGSQENDSKSTD